jgi:hypothetical protein
MLWSLTDKIISKQNVTQHHQRVHIYKLTGESCLSEQLWAEWIRRAKWIVAFYASRCYS